MATPLKLLIAGTLLAACAGTNTSTTATPSANQPAAITTTPTDHANTITNSDTGCTLEVAADVTSSGPTELTVVNETETKARFDLWRISDEHSYDEFAAHIAEERRRAEAGEPGLGHPDYVTDLKHFVTRPNETETRGPFDLRPGTYGIACLREFGHIDGERPFDTAGPLNVEP